MRLRKTLRAAVMGTGYSIGMTSLFALAGLEVAGVSQLLPQPIDYGLAARGGALLGSSIMTLALGLDSWLPAFRRNRLLVETEVRTQMDLHLGAALATSVLTTAMLAYSLKPAAAPANPTAAPSAPATAPVPQQRQQGGGLRWEEPRAPAKRQKLLQTHALRHTIDG